MMRNYTIKHLFAAIFMIFSMLCQAQDTTPPVFDDYEVELEVECSDLHLVQVTATDDSGEEVELTYDDAVFSGGCTDNIVRTYTATDGSGNSSTAVQILVVFDETPPIFIGVGENMTISCEELVPEVPEIEVYDECSEEEILDYTFTSSVEEGVCVTVITWTWGATDECENYGEHSKTITIVDETPPVFSEDPDDFYIGCEEEYPIVPELTAEDNCTEVTITFEEEVIEGGVEGGAAYCTASDVSYLNKSFSMKLIDSPAQENYITSDLVLMQQPDIGDGVTAVLSGNVYGFDNPSIGWYVYMEFENGMNWEEWSNQPFPTGYRDDFEIAEETHLDWTYLLLNSTNSYFIGLGDYDGSELQLSHIPTNYYYGFQLGYGAPNFSTNYGISGWFLAEGVFYDAGSPDEEIVNGIDFSAAGDIYTDLVCCPIETLVRTWTAEDECENQSQVQQLITKIDILAPEFTYVPDDLLIDCTMETPEDMAEAEDNCGDVTVTFEDELEVSDCPTEYTIYRTFTAVDDCGLSAHVTQIITVTDTHGPELSPMPEDLTIPCDLELPDAPAVTATDECEGEVDVVFTENVVGDMGPEGAEAYCNATTPINSVGGWSGILFDELLGDILVETVEAKYTQFPDGGDGATAYITALLQSMTNENAGWELELTLVNGMNWDDWSNQDFPTSYKDDLGTAEDYYQDWTYFILQSGSLTGWGDWEGTSLELGHAPINHFYGFQLGEQAANVNSEYGVGGWIVYSGTIYDEASESVVLVDGGGDLAFDLDCCPMYSVVRNWSATDCAGNETSHTQVISYGEQEMDTPVANDKSFDLTGIQFEEIIQLNMLPNPVKSSSEVNISSKVNIAGKLKLYSAQGLLIQSLWSGDLEKGTNRKVIFNKGDMAPGIYILKLSTNAGEVASKFMVEE